MSGFLTGTARNFVRTAALTLATAGIVGAEIVPVDGTTGAPLGGIGTGAVKFSAYQGKFYGAFEAPCGASNFTTLPNMQFQLFTNRNGTILTSQKLSAVVTNSRADDDAIYPAQYANLGVTGGVSVNLTAFAPYDPAHLSRMCYPYAFYEIKLKNTQASAVTAAVALQIQSSANPTIVAGKGLRTTVDRALYGSCDKAGATLSMGGDNGFFTSGVCSNTISGTTNRVAFQVSLAANDSALVQFVFAWCRSDVDRYWYANTATNAAAFADTGLVNFAVFKTKAVELVTRMRASNFPGWLINHTLNSLCNLTNSSIYTKDGRHGYTEGQWGMNGTMDQMWHARQIFAMLVPDLVWQELRYWARTQKRDPEGQIHHDFAGYSGMRVLCAWDDQQHGDYRDIDKWVDLNCAFIISTYEAFMANADRAQLDWIWPYVKKAAQRILNLAAQYPAAGYPYMFAGTENSYDAGGNPDPYNGSMAVATFKVMTRLAALENDAVLVSKYQGVFDTACASFTKRYLTNNFPGGHLAESVLAGQWIGYFLRLGDFYPRARIDYGIRIADVSYRPLEQGMGHPGGTYSEWGPYVISHLGGLYLQTGLTDRWRALERDYAERMFDNRNQVFNTKLDIPAKVTSPTYLATDSSGYNQYMSLPVLWRNYYTLVGYQRNKNTGELWIEPVIPQEMNHVMKDALIISPEGYVTISCTESGAKFQNRNITIKADASMPVTALYLRDDYGQNVSVSIGGAQKAFTRIGRDYSKAIKIDWNSSLTPAGTTIVISGDTSETINSMIPSDPYDRIEAEMYTTKSAAIQAESCGDVDGGSNIGFVTNNTFIAFNNLNFNQGGALSCSLRVALPSANNCSVEVRLDSVNGTLVGTASVPATGAWQTWVTVGCPITAQCAGAHKLFLVFKSAGGFASNCNWFKFVPRTPVAISGNPVRAAINSGGIALVKGALLVTTIAAGPYRIEFTSLNGRIIHSIEGAGRGTHRVDLSSGRLGIARGICLVTVSQAERRITERVLTTPESRRQ